jgi:hypothetical protein
MKRTNRNWSASFCLLLLCLAGCAESGMDTVTYRGEEIRLSRTYADFDEYKDDENNLPAAEIERVATLVRTAPVAASYPSQEAAFHSLFGLMFPGYGFSAMNPGEPVALFALEVPKMSEQRYLVFVQQDDRWTRVDDFLWPDSKGLLNAVNLTDGHLRYMDHKGEVLREKAL